VQHLKLWLQATQQGVWPCQLPLAVQTKCLGWLLFLLSLRIQSGQSMQGKLETGINLSLCFQTIHNALPAQAIHHKSYVKAIHLKVDEHTSTQKCRHLASLYSSAAIVFPLGIQMHLVPEHRHPSLGSPTKRSLPCNPSWLTSWLNQRWPNSTSSSQANWTSPSNMHHYGQS